MKSGKVKRKDAEQMIRVQLYVSVETRNDLRKFSGRHSFGVGVKELLRREKERQRGSRVMTQNKGESS